ncbi:MAG: hypothetical protein PUA68_01810 [Bacilli bacterium]|nr:hypothetical protein [Bacilli bacterium]
MDYFNNDLKLENKDIFELTKILVLSQQLQKYCKSITLTGQNYFSYSNFERTITLPDEQGINGNKLQNRMISAMKEKNRENIMFENKESTDKIFILFAILHELEHANQQKNIIENYEHFDKIYIENLISSITNRHFVTSTNFYHDLAYHEYDANLNAILKINEINSKKPLEGIENLNQYGAHLILNSYYNKNNEIESPLSQNDKLTKSNRENNIRDFKDNYDHKDDLVDLNKEFKNAFFYSIEGSEKLSNDLHSRLLRGDNLTKQEIEMLHDIANGKIKTDNLFNTLDQNKKIFEAPELREGEIGKLFR